jgi:hypothetical protein
MSNYVESLTWLTDLHLEFCSHRTRDRFYHSNRDARKHCEDGHKKENGALREGIANRARHHCDSHIACMIIRCVPPHAAGQYDCIDG